MPVARNKPHREFKPLAIQPIGSPKILEIKADRKSIYQVYEVLFSADLAAWKKNTMLTTLMGGYMSSWKVIAVSDGALQALRDFDAGKIAHPKVERAHIYPRSTVSKLVFQRKYTASQFFRLFERDYTVLTTKKEHKKVLEDTLFVHPVPADLNLFHCKAIGFRYEVHEKHWISQKKPKPIPFHRLLRQLNIQPPQHPGGAL